MRRIGFLTVGLASLIGLAACGSGTALTVTTSMSAGDRPATSVGSPGTTASAGGADTTTPNESVPSQASLPPTASPPPNVSGPPDVSLPPGLTLPPGISLPTGISLPPGLTLPPGISLPDLSGITIPDLSGISIPNIPVGTFPGESADCAAFTKVFAEAFGASKDGTAALTSELASLAATIPDQYKADLTVIGDAFTKLQAIYTKYGYDYTKILADPSALAVLSDPAFGASLGRLDGYYSGKCSGTGS